MIKITNIKEVDVTKPVFILFCIAVGGLIGSKVIGYMPLEFVIGWTINVFYVNFIYKSKTKEVKQNGLEIRSNREVD